MITTLFALLAVYAGFVGLLWSFQRHVMYRPSQVMGPPGGFGLDAVEEVSLSSADGTKLKLWVARAAEGFPTVLYFHGNAGHLGDRALKLRALVRAGFGVMAVSYRGYGGSGGRPFEAGIYADARASLDYVCKALGTGPEKLIYFGESLGTGVAVRLAVERPPGLLFLEAAYLSVETRSAELYPYILGIRRLVRDKYDSLSRIRQVHAPLLMLHGAEDPVIPLRHAQALFAAANAPKRLVVCPHAHHTDFTDDQILAPLMEEALKGGLLAATAAAPDISAATPPLAAG